MHYATQQRNERHYCSKFDRVALGNFASEESPISNLLSQLVQSVAIDLAHTAFPQSICLNDLTYPNPQVTSKKCLDSRAF